MDQTLKEKWAELVKTERFKHINKKNGEIHDPCCYPVYLDIIFSVVGLLIRFANIVSSW